MNIMGAIIKSEEIIGISPLHHHMRQKPSEFQLTFAVITRSSCVEFKSPIISDFQYATKEEQSDIGQFRSGYESAYDAVARLVDEQPDEAFHHERPAVTESFDAIVEYHRLLEDELNQLRVKNRVQLVSLLNEMRPHIINLKNLAE